MKELSWPERGRLWFRLGLRLLFVLLVCWAVTALGPTLLSLFAPFLLALLAAWALSPLVRWLHGKLGLSRNILSLALLLLVFAALGALLWSLFTGILREVVSLAGNWEALVASLQSVVDRLGVLFSRGMAHLPASARATADSLVEQFFQWLETVIPRFLTAVVDKGTSLVTALPSFAVASIVFVMACYFIVSDFPHLRTSLADRLPQGPRYVLSLVRRAVSAGFGGYIRAELILSAGVFVILLAGFFLIHQPYALLLALALAVLDFIPILGSGTVMVPWAVIDLFTGQLRHAVGLMVVWGLVALFRRVGEPKVLGNQTGLSPLLSLASIYVGMQLAGVAGMILGPVLCLVVLNVLRSGILDNVTADIRLAAGDISALLKGGSPDNFNNSTYDF